MPIYRGYTTVKGKRMGWFRWGDSGKKYTYIPGNERSRKSAKKKAVKQAQAAYSAGYRKRF